MSKKYDGRGNSFFSPADEIEKTSSKQPEWFDEFVSNFEKLSVQSRESKSIHEEISAIMGNSKHSSVEAALLDMKQRSGLEEFLKKQAGVEPDLFHQFPQLKVFIDNYIEDRPGLAPEAIVHAVLRMKNLKELLPNKSDLPASVKKYISDKIAELKTTNGTFDSDDVNSELGKLDLNNAEQGEEASFFASCLPNSGK